MKKVNNTRYHGRTAPVIDGISGDPQIAGLWSTKFKELYNRCNPSTRNSLQEQLNSIITEDDLETLLVDTDTVICAIKRLKAGKSDGKSLMSDHDLYAPPILASKLSRLFTALLRHGYTSRCLRDSIIQPIPKGFKDPAMSANYRGIALAPCFSKLLELCILMLFPDVFYTSDLQFGFKRGFSTDLCTGLLKLVSSRYIHQGSKVRCALLDMSKAFDLVDHGLLFQLLLERNLPCSATRFLLQWYSSQQLQIRWNGILSSPFPVSNGVRQGGVLSPILFTVYIDELL